jgi:N-succinyl-L-ornithine transcarbamylase
MRNFISVNDVSNINELVKKALAYKANPLSDGKLGADKRIGLLFLNPSLRTRLSTQVAAANLGLEAIVFNVDKEGWALEFEEGAIMSGTTVEHVKDAAPILGQYFDMLCIRAFPGLKNKAEDYSEQVMNAFIQFAGVPIISLESSTLHPLQSLTDIITIQENFKANRKPKIVLSWAPHN